MIDTHAHLQFSCFDADREAILKACRARSMRLMVVGTTYQTSQDAVTLSNAHPFIYSTIGVHPSHVHEATRFHDEREAVNDMDRSWNEDEWVALFATAKRCVAVGEVGMDAYRLPEDADEQERIMAAQETALWQAIRLASRLEVPVVLHIREAHARAQEVLRQAIVEGLCARRGVVHCFTGTQAEADAWIALGFWISFSGIVTFPDKKQPGVLTPLQQVAQTIPIDRLLVETDAPYLAPVPYRGQLCVPWMVESTASFVAALRSMTLEAFWSVVDANADACFRFSNSLDPRV